jgi:hypothetical protein
MSGHESHVVNGGAITPKPARRLVLPAGATTHAGSAEPPSPTVALAQMRSHVAQTLHETVMQTLVATTYLAESPTTSRRDLVRYLRQATHELRCVIDHVAASEAGSERAAPPEPSMAPAVRAS